MLAFPSPADSERFRVIRRLGAGGMGIVYEAEDREVGALVALKRLKQMSAEGLQRFKNEFRLMHDLEHRNLAHMGELFQERGDWFFTMELVEGIPFTEFGRPSNAPSLGVPVEERYRPALRQLALVVHFLHSSGIIHRDIKPSNVLVTPEGRLVLLDFGLVTRTRLDNRGDEASHSIAGTLGYMAPEQAQGQHVGPPSDWYSVGVMLYETLTGTLPWSGGLFEILLNRKDFVPAHPKDELASTPDDIDALCMDLLQLDPAARPSGDEILARLQVGREQSRSGAGPSLPPGFSSDRAPFVGRRRELEALDAAFAQVQRERCSATVVVEGESGVGKSALVQRFSERVRTQTNRVVVLSGRCYEREAVRYKAVDGVMDAFAKYMARLDPVDAAGLLPREAFRLVSAFPVLGQVKAFARASNAVDKVPLPPQELRGRVFSAIRDMFSRVSMLRPVVMVIDDLQWADADSLVLLTEMLRPPEEPSVLLLLTMRSNIPNPAVTTWAKTAPDVRRIALERLPLADTQDLIVALLEQRASMRPPERIEAIAKETGGHPLFIQQLVNRPQAVGGAMNLDDVLRECVATLAAPLRHMLELVVVAGRPIAQDVITRAAGVEPSETFRAWSALRVEHLIQSMGGKGADQVWSYHDRIREAIVGSMDDQTRRERHRELAQALEASDTKEDERLALHWLEAGEGAKAREHMVRAAESSCAALAFDHAANLLQQALHLLPEEHPDRHGLIIRVAEMLVYAGRGVAAAQRYVEAAEQSTPKEALLLRRRAAEQYLRSGHIKEGLNVSRQVMASLGLYYPRSTWLALAMVVFWRVLLLLRGVHFKPRPAGEVPERVLDQCDVYWSTTLGLQMIDPIRVMAFNCHALMLAMKAGDELRFSRALGVHTCQSVFFFASRKRTEKLLRRYRRGALVLVLPEERAGTFLVPGVVRFGQGDFQAAVAHLTQAESIFHNECLGMSWEMTTTRIFLMNANFALGQLARLSRRVPELVANARDRGDLYASSLLSLGCGIAAWLVQDDIETARRTLDDLCTNWQRHDFYATQFRYHLETIARIEFALYTGAPAYPLAIEHDRAIGYRYMGLAHWGQALLHRGRAALAHAHHCSGSERRRALADAARCGRRLLRERLLWCRVFGSAISAAVAFCRGDVETAVEDLEKSLAEVAETSQDLPLCHILEWHLGLIIGGDRGRYLKAAGEAGMLAQTIRNPHRWAASIAPGFYRA